MPRLSRIDYTVLVMQTAWPKQGKLHIRRKSSSREVFIRQRAVPKRHPSIERTGKPRKMIQLALIV